MQKPNIKIKKRRLNKNKNTKEVKQKVRHVAQELKFARLLASNEKKTRDRALKALKKWFLHCCQNNIELTNDNFDRIWSGLFYTVWMCDKPLIQEEIIDNIAELMEIFPENLYDYSLKYMKSAFKILAKDWYGLDQYRMDKFMMLVRRLLRSMFRKLKTTNFEVSKCRSFTNLLIDNDGVLAPISPRYAQNAVGLKIHIAECYIEELAKICEGEIDDNSFTELLSSFAVYMCTGQEHRVVIASTQVFYELIRQTEMIMEYQNEDNYENDGEDEDADDNENDADDEDAEDNESLIGSEEVMDRKRPLDPRAGRVDVTINPLNIPTVPLIMKLRGMMSKCVNVAASSRCYVLIERLKTLDGCLEIEANRDKDNFENTSDQTSSGQDFGPRPFKYIPFSSQYDNKNKVGEMKRKAAPVKLAPVKPHLLKSAPVKSRRGKAAPVESAPVKSPTKRGTKGVNLVKEPRDAGSPKKARYGKRSVKFVLSKNTTQDKSEFLKSLQLSPHIPFDSKKQPNKPCIKNNTPSPVNPFNKLITRNKIYYT